METYRKVVNFLKRACPPDCKINVRRVKLPDHLDGDCGLKRDRFLVRINRTLPEHEAIETLIHEMAHVLSWDRCPLDEHCDEWGKSYSRLYRSFLKEFIEA
jgi:hypothetical protein